MQGLPTSPDFPFVYWVNWSSQSQAASAVAQLTRFAALIRALLNCPEQQFPAQLPTDRNYNP